MATHSFRDLIVWQKAMDLVELAYAITKELPDYERYALADQMRRSAISIPSNIAEGQKRQSKAEMSHFLSISLGSAAELETQAILCKRLYNSEIELLLQMLAEVSKMLTALSKTLRTKN